MSSKPSVDGVAKVKHRLRHYRRLSEKLKELSEAAKQIPGVEEEMRTMHREIIGLLESMDVKADGNCGWEGRMLWFLSDLERQATTGEE